MAPAIFSLMESSKHAHEDGDLGAMGPVLAIDWFSEKQNRFGF
jgi:hypothetical protein